MHVERDGKQYAMVPPEQAAAAAQVNIPLLSINCSSATLAKAINTRWYPPSSLRPPPCSWPLGT